MIIQENITERERMRENKTAEGERMLERKEAM